MSKIRPNQFRDILLGKGYFPKELPPVFKTADFGRQSQQIMGEWASSELFKFSPVKGRSGSYKLKLPVTECEIISAPKHGYARRPISLVHPISQAILANEIGEHWPTISKWLQRQRYNIDVPRISEKYSRGVSSIDFKTHKAKLSFIEGTADWLGKADVTRFYHSIYTHSLAWAAHGKEDYKSDPKKYRDALADRLDSIVRACNRNQTIGIPVGPETSRILADIISSRIDSEVFLKTDIPQRDIDRLQDDWHVGVGSLEKADAFISILIDEYRKFELDLNGEKTSVDQTKTHLEADWVQEILAFLSHRFDRLSGQRLRAFLALILKLQKEHIRAPVVSYGISVIEGGGFSAGDIEDVESFLLKSASMSPKAMDRICALLINLNRQERRLSKQRIGDRLSSLAVRNLGYGNHFEAIWQIFALRGLKYVITDEKLVDLGSTSSPSVIPLMLLDMKSKGLCVRTLPITDWEKRVDRSNVLSSPSWLLAYEGIRHGWLQDRHKLSSSSFFEPLLKRDVVFYDDRRNVIKTEKMVARKKISNRYNRLRMMRYITLLRGFGGDFTDYD